MNEQRLFWNRHLQREDRFQCWHTVAQRVDSWSGFHFHCWKQIKKQCSDTMQTPRHIPLYHYSDAQDFFDHVPYNCPVVAVELSEKSIPLEKYSHHERCIYLLGAEDGGIPTAVLDRCVDVVQIMGDYCYNVAVAGSIVMYDRAVKRR